MFPDGLTKLHIILIHIPLERTLSYTLNQLEGRLWNADTTDNVLAVISLGKKSASVLSASSTLQIW